MSFSRYNWFIAWVGIRAARPANFQPEPGWARRNPARSGSGSARSSPIFTNTIFFTLFLLMFKKFNPQLERYNKIRDEK